MKLTKFGILVTKKTTYLFPSIRDSNISRGCTKILENPEGRGLYGKSLPWGGGMEIFWNHTLHVISKLFKQDETGKEPGKHRVNDKNLLQLSTVVRFG